MQKNEREHLKAFVQFVQSKQPGAVLRDQGLGGVARRYNGPKFKENKYDEKLTAAYAKFSA